MVRGGTSATASPMWVSDERPGGVRQWRIYSVRSCRHRLAGAALLAAVLWPYAFKAHMRSIYRKLDATIRNQAITRARELGLIEG